MPVSKRIKQHLTAGQDMRKKDIFIGNFIGGIAWGLGTVIGATVIIAVITAVLNRLGLLDPLKWFFGYQ